MEDFSAPPDKDNMLSVSAGQLVEVLSGSGKEAWLVQTHPQVPGEKQEEGYLPPSLLKPAKLGTVQTTPTATSTQ